jgi:hypothetical protein
VVLWLERRQNKDVVEWWGEWPRLRRSFYRNRGWESSVPERVACGGGADSMLQFQLERGRDGTKHSQNMNQRQRARLDSMGRKHDTVQRRDDIGRKRGNTEERKGRK